MTSQAPPEEPRLDVVSGNGPTPVHIQLVPFAEGPDPKPTLKEVVDRKMKEGQTMRIGRQVVREGQPTGRAANPLLQGVDVWFTSKVVSRNHAEMWLKDNQVYIKDIGSSSGTFLNKMRLSPSGKESRPYPIKEGDVVQFGIDYKGKQEDIYKSIVVKIQFYDQSWIVQQRKRANPVRFKNALTALLAATNPYGSTKTEEENAEDSQSTDCCICIGPIGPYQALFIAPCSHCFHYKCVGVLIAQSSMFQCPLCRQVANLAASVSMESLYDSADEQENRNREDHPVEMQPNRSGNDTDVEQARREEEDGAFPGDNTPRERNSQFGFVHGTVTPPTGRANEYGATLTAGLNRSTTTPAGATTDGSGSNGDEGVDSADEASHSVHQRAPVSREGTPEGSGKHAVARRARAGSNGNELGVSAGSSPNTPTKRRHSITNKLNAFLGRKAHNSSDHHLTAAVIAATSGTRNPGPFSTAKFASCASNAIVCIEAADADA
ncbi:hypothetical protein BJ742DRAFT_51825 [Cladochytrium replicatum]|nr:hypothetical protein BJ742DRAFT_51825 [Cladochytrium replicatum]